MHLLLNISRGVDWITERIGRAIGWLLLAAVLISTGNAIIRKAFGDPVDAATEVEE